MKIFVLANNLNRPGFRQRIELYLDILRENGIDCEVEELPCGLLARRKLFKRAVDFDGVLLHKKGLNPFDAFWLRRYSKKIIYHFDDAIMYSTKRPDRYSPSHFRPFRRSVKLADMVITGSAYLAKQAHQFNPHVEIVPHCIKVSDYSVHCASEDDGKIRLVWIGSQSTLKYLAEIKPALEEIGSRFDNVILRIICDDFFDLRSLPVEKRLWSKDTRAIHLAQSDIGLAPLPEDRFTRGKCSFKVLEYACAGIPVVASPVGTNADYVRDNVTGFLATDKSQWIDSISTLIERSDLRRTMGLAAREMAADFDVAVIGKRLCDVMSNYIT